LHSFFNTKILINVYRNFHFYKKLTSENQNCWPFCSSMKKQPFAHKRAAQKCLNFLSFSEKVRTHQNKIPRVSRKIWLWHKLIHDSFFRKTDTINSTRDSSKLGAEINDNGMTRHTVRQCNLSDSARATVHTQVVPSSSECCCCQVLPPDDELLLMKVTLLKISSLCQGMPFFVPAQGSSGSQNQPAWRRHFSVRPLLDELTSEYSTHLEIWSNPAASNI